VRKYATFRVLTLASQSQLGRFAMTNTNRHSNQPPRHSQTRVRDAFFAVCVVLATAVSLVSVSTASHAASTADVSMVSR